MAPSKRKHLDGAAAQILNLGPPALFGVCVWLAPVLAGRPPKVGLLGALAAQLGGPQKLGFWGPWQLGRPLAGRPAN